MVLLRATEELKKLDEELKTLDPVTDKTRIDEIKNVEIPSASSKKSNNKNMFMDFCTRNKIEIDKDFLDNLLEEQGFSHTKDGDIRISKTLKNISKGYDKRIATYEKAIEKIPGAKIYEDNVERRESSEKFRDAYKYDLVKDYVNDKEKTIFKEATKEMKQSNRDEER